MSTITWASATSGTFSTAADWAGGIAPGPADTALINASGAAYTIDIASAADVAALKLESAQATLLLASALTASRILLQAGDLVLENHASLSGTITDSTAASVAIAGNGPSHSTVVTLDDVTWNGLLNPTFDLTKFHAGTLVIAGGITLHGSTGAGPGTATLQSVTLNDVASLDNATISITGAQGALTVTNTPTLTLGTHLTLTGDMFGLAGETVINDGKLIADEAASTGTFVNNGSLTVQGLTGFDQSSSATIAGFGGASFTNNGKITVAAGAHLILDAAALQTPGAGGKISLQGGVLEIVGSLTTAQLLAIYASQHITGTTTAGTAYGFGVLGTLTNTGATLDVGPATKLGELNLAAVNGASAGGTIYGGTINVESGGGTLASQGSSTGIISPTLLSNLQLNSSNPTLTLVNISLSNDTITGSSSVAIDNATSGLFAVNTTVSNTVFSGVSTLAVVGDGVTLNGLSFTGLAGGPTVDVGRYGTLGLGAGQDVAGWTINNGGDLILSIGGTYSNLTLNQTNYTIDTSMQAGTLGFGLGTTLTIDTYGNSQLVGTSDETFNNQGMITALSGGPDANLNLYIGAFNNAGNIAITTLRDTSGAFTNSGTIATASLELQNATNTGTISSSTLTISQLTNNGMVSGNDLTFDGGVTGSGTIAVSYAQGALSAVQFTAGLGSGQTVALTASADTTLTFMNTQIAGDAISGTLAGFHVGDIISLGNDTPTAARFIGDSISITLSTGATLALATATALTGTLSVASGEITYTSATPSLHDWSAAPVADAASPTRGHAAMAAPLHEPADTMLLLAHHGIHL